jgi:ABC-type proline/glycine betaine transport system permease subunit
LNLESVRKELIKGGQVLLVKLDDMLSKGLGSGLAATVDVVVAVAVTEDESVGASVIESIEEESVGDGIELPVASVTVILAIVVDGTVTLYVTGLPNGARFLKSLATWSCSER